MKRGRVSWLATVIVTVIAVGVITYLGVVIFYTLYRVLEPRCIHDRVTAVVSPDAIYVARSFRRNCGTLSPFTTHVFLRRQGSADDGKEERVFAFTGTEVTLRWQAPRTLVIEHNACPAVIWEQRGTWLGVSIRYHKLDLPSDWRCRAPSA